MKKFFKRFLFSLGIVFAVGVLSSCTKSFCNVQDQAEMISIYAKNNIESINTTAQNNGILIPQEDFNTFIDNKVQEYLNSDICPVDNEGNKIESFARYAGYNKDGQAELFYNYNTWVEEAKNEIGVNNVPGKSYITYYQSSLTRGIRLQLLVLLQLVDILDLKETKDMYLEKHGDKHLLIMDSLKDYLFIQLPVCFIILL